MGGHCLGFDSLPCPRGGRLTYFGPLPPSRDGGWKDGGISKCLQSQIMQEMTSFVPVDGQIIIKHGMM